MNRTDTCIGFPKSRPAVPAPADLIPGFGLQRVTRHTVRRPWWVRYSPATHLGWAVGGAIAVILIAALVVFTALTGGAQ